MIFFAIRVLLQCVTTEWSVLGSAPQHIGVVVTCSVMACAEATFALSATLLLDVAHLEEVSLLQLGAAFIYDLTWYHTSAALNTFLTKLSASLLPITKKTTNDAVISLFCFLSLMVTGFAKQLTWVGIPIPSFYASNS
jgi:hypothetical protein